MTIIDQFIPERRQGIIEESANGLLAVCTPSVIHIFTAREGKPHSYIPYAALKTNTKEGNFHATTGTSELNTELSAIILHGHTEGFRSILWMGDDLLALHSTGLLCCMSMKSHFGGWRPLELPHLPTKNLTYNSIAYDEPTRTLALSYGMGTLLLYSASSHSVKEYSITNSRIVWMRFSGALGGLLCITEAGELILTNTNTGKTLWSHSDGILQPVGFMELGGKVHLTKFNRIYSLDVDFKIDSMSLDEQVDLPVAGVIPDADGKNPLAVTSDGRLFKVDFRHNTVTSIQGTAPWKRFNSGDSIGDDKSDDEEDDESAPSTPTTSKAPAQAEGEDEIASKKAIFLSTIKNDRVWIVEAEHCQYPMPDRALLYQHRLSFFDQAQDSSISANNPPKDIKDRCPTCQKPFTSQSLKFALCESGHVFDICPMHSVIIKDALKAKKCLVCGIVACPSDTACPCGSHLLPVV